MGRKRQRIPLREELAAALALLLPAELRTELREQRVPAETIRSLFEMHHVVLHTWGGADRWWNLVPMTEAKHAERTPGDQRAAAKVKRIAPEHEAFRRRLLAKSGQAAPEPKKPRKRARIAPRGFPKREEMRFDWKSRRYVKERS